MSHRGRCQLSLQELARKNLWSMQAKCARQGPRAKGVLRWGSTSTAGGVNAFSRYENGKTKPPLALVKLLKVLERHPDLLNEVRTD